jgi:hypothetical protein
MSKTSLLALLLLVTLLVVFFQSRSIKTTDIPDLVGLRSFAPLKKYMVNKVNSDLDTFDKTPTQSLKESDFDPTTTIPDPENGLQAVDRIWGKVISTSENKVFQLKIYANAVCEVLPNTATEQYFSKNGADPVRPQYGTNWPSGVGIKIRDKTGEILGVKNGFSTGWMNPNWGGSGYLITDEVVPMYSDGLDLSELMKHLIQRIPGELADNADMGQLEFKLKIFTSTASILKSDGTAVPPADRDDFESEWISGRYLEAKP